jgi:uncharacterized damage-inducible protein DinB
MNTELADLFRRDLKKLASEIRAFPDAQTLWQKSPGIKNSAGNLALHLEGNMREYIGRQLGGIPYRRERSQEFALNGISVAELAQRSDELVDLIPDILAKLSAAQLDAIYPENVLGTSLPTRQFLIHLFGHFNYHLGQIDYLRRMLTQGDAVLFAGL